jgi:hypothetical protein
MAQRKAARSAGQSEGRQREGKGTAKAPRKFGGYSEAWMPGFIADATDSLNIVTSAKAHGVSLAELVRHRADDPAFDAAVADVERSIGLAVRETLRGSAANGDTRAASLLMRRRVELADLAGDGPGQEVPLPHVAAAMIAAGLAAALGGPDALCPHCRQPYRE